MLSEERAASMLMTRPDRCPTYYACVQEDDDRAESAVAYLTGAPLDDARARAISKTLRRPASTEAEPREIMQVRNRLPALSPFTFRIDHQAKGGFKVVGSRRRHEPTILTLGEYWASLGIEPPFPPR